MADRLPLPSSERDYPSYALEAITKALIDASGGANRKLTYDDVQYVAAGYVYGDSTCGQRAVYQMGMTGVPIVNVNNNCSTGSSAFALACDSVRSGMADVALAVGFEKMFTGSLRSFFPDRAAPTEGFGMQFDEIEQEKNYEVKDFGPNAARQFGAAGTEYCEKYGATWDHIAQISAKNHKHSKDNEYAQFRSTPSPEEVQKARKITREVTLPMCSPTSDGGGAAIVCSERFIRQLRPDLHLQDRAVEVAAIGMATDSPKLYESRSRMELAGFDMTRRAARKAYEAAGITPADVQVLELHDCFAPNELITYDALELCKPGEAHKIVERGDNTFGGKWVINVSGGLESKGHPLGATGLGMIKYMVDQVRGDAGPMQVKNVKNAMAHNLGLGGSAVVTILRKPTFWQDGAKAKDRFGYNAGYECRRVTEDEFNAVRSQKAFSDYLAPHL